jgi:hypothetical protein
MPYLTKERQDLLLEQQGFRPDSTPGDLNFLLTLIIQDYLEQKKESYQTLNDIVGGLECCKQEFIRRVVNPYEDSRIISNGDIYE